MLKLDVKFGDMRTREGEHPNFRNLPLPPLPLPPPPGRPKFNDLRCGNKRQSKPASSVAEPAREAPRPQQVAVARHWPNAKGHPSQTVDGRNIRTPADMSRPPFPPISMLSRDRLGHGCSRGSIISSTRPTSPRDLSNIAVGGKGGTRSSRVRIFLPSTVPVVGASVDA